MRLIEIGFLAIWSIFITTCFAGQAQFYDTGSSFGVAISLTNSNNGGEDVSMQISAPTSYGWAAIGTGDKMDNSLMFIIYSSGQDEEVTLSVRSASGHDTPESISSVNATLHSSEAKDGSMVANIAWHQTPTQKQAKIDAANKKQPWIWAVGPKDQSIGNPSSVDAKIEQHSSYGVLFADMSASVTADDSTPSISGKNNVNTISQPSYYHNLVYIHAVLLGGAFVLVFPFGAIGLRLKFDYAFKIHWLLQTVATVAAYVGVMVAIGLSVSGIEYASFDEEHQIIGLVVVVLVSVQVFLGWLHHRNYKKFQGRTVPSYIHIGLGRVVIYLGMVNAVLGALLSDETAVAVGVGVVGVVLAAGLEYVAFRHRRQPRGRYDTLAKSTSNIALNSFNG